MSKRPYIKLFSADLHNDTRDMNWIECAIYINLLMAQWSKSNGMLKAAPRRIQKSSGVPTRIWNQYGPEVLEEFFITSECGTFVYNDRMYQDWLNVQDVSEARAKAGKSGGKSTQEKRRWSTHHPQNSCGDAQTIADTKANTIDGTLSNDINDGDQANASNLPEICSDTRDSRYSHSYVQKEEREKKNQKEETKKSPPQSSSGVTLQQPDDDTGGILSDLDELEEVVDGEVEALEDRIRSAVGKHAPRGFTDAEIRKHLIEPTEPHRKYWTDEKLVDLARFVRLGVDVHSSISSVKYLAKSAPGFMEKDRREAKTINGKSPKRADWSDEAIDAAVARIESQRAAV